MKVIAFLALCGLASAGVLQAPAALSNTGSSHSSRTQDSIGNYNFAYTENHATGGTSRKESGNAYGQVVGSYSLGVVDGRQRTVNYVADGHGFRAQVLTNEPGTAPTAQTVAKVAAPVAGYGAPIASYAAPVASYAAPRYASYAAPAVSYGSYAAPVASYAAPRYASYAAPALSYAAPRYASYAAPAVSYAAPAVVKTAYAAPVASYAAPSIAYGATTYKSVVSHAPVYNGYGSAPIVQRAW